MIKIFNLQKNMISRLFEIKKLNRSNIQIVLWWELRRIIFNLLILCFIYFGLKIINLNILEIEMGTGQYFVFLILIGVAIILNILYTFGWILELLRKRTATFAPKLLKKMTINSLILLTILISLLYPFLNWTQAK